MLHGDIGSVRLTHVLRDNSSRRTCVWPWFYCLVQMQQYTVCQGCSLVWSIPILNFERDCISSIVLRFAMCESNLVIHCRYVGPLWYQQCQEIWYRDIISVQLTAPWTDRTGWLPATIHWHIVNECMFLQDFHYFSLAVLRTMCRLKAVNFLWYGWIWGIKPGSACFVLTIR